MIYWIRVAHLRGGISGISPNSYSSGNGKVELLNREVFHLFHIFHVYLSLMIIANKCTLSHHSDKSCEFARHREFESLHLRTLIDDKPCISGVFCFRAVDDWLCSNKAL